MVDDINFTSTRKILPFALRAQKKIPSNFQLKEMQLAHSQYILKTMADEIFCTLLILETRGNAAQSFSIRKEVSLQPFQVSSGLVAFQVHYYSSGSHDFLLIFSDSDPIQRFKKPQFGNSSPQCTDTHVSSSSFHKQRKRSDIQYHILRTLQPNLCHGIEASVWVTIAICWIA